MSEKTKGYVLVASNKINFYRYAINLAESILDYHEDAKITLFTEEWMFEEGHRDLFDNVEWCSDHYRAKLEGMARSPYDLTMYLDVDMEVEHEDIGIVFDELEKSGKDLLFSELTDDRSYVYAERDFDTPEGKRKFTLCGGVALYDMTVPLVKEFMQEWDDLTKRQMNKEWWPEGYAESLQSWDQFSLWWLTEKVDKYKDLNYGIFEDDLRWNYYNAFNAARTMPEAPIVIRHYSCGLDKDGYII
jgi:hypothetical protein